MWEIAAAAVTAAAAIYSASQQNKQSAQNANSANALQGAQFDATRQDNLAYYEATQRYNSLEAEKARQYGLELSGSAYQRAMADMKAAGLNPMLAYQQGGASTPQSVSASSGMQSSPAPPRAHVPQVGQVLGPAVSAAFQTAQVMTGLEQTAANTRLADAQARNVAADEKRTRVDTLFRAAEAARSNADTERIRNTAVTEAQRPAQVQAETARAGAEAGLAGERREGQRLENQNTREFGRPGAVGSAGSSAAAVGRAIQEGPAGDAARALGGAAGRAAGRVYYNWGSGSRYPSQPNVPRTGTMDYLY